MTTLQEALMLSGKGLEDGGLLNLKNIPKKKFLEAAISSKIKTIFGEGGFLKEYDPTKWEGFNLDKLGINLPSDEVLTRAEKLSTPPSSLPIKMEESNVLNHFEKHQGEFPGIKDIAEYKEAIKDFLKKFSGKLNPTLIIRPTFSSVPNKTSNDLEMQSGDLSENNYEKESKLFLEDLETGEFLILTNRQGRWYFSTFFSGKIENITKFEDIWSQVLHYQNCLKSGLYNDPKTRKLLIEKLKEAELAYKFAIKTYQDVSETYQKLPLEYPKLALELLAQEPSKLEQNESLEEEARLQDRKPIILNKNVESRTVNAVHRLRNAHLN
jgi:hypothetical protein